MSHRVSDSPRERLIAPTLFHSRSPPRGGSTARCVMTKRFRYAQLNYTVVDVAADAASRCDFSDARVGKSNVFSRAGSRAGRQREN